jgi:hypothetical protein
MQRTRRRRSSSPSHPADECHQHDVGAGIIVAMQNYLSGFGEWVLVIRGAIFVITVLLFRRGIVGEIIALANRGRTVHAAKREETVV